MSLNPDTIVVSGIRLTPYGIVPVDGNLAMLVRRDDIREVSLCYGFRSAHPVLQFLFGLTLFGFCGYAVAIVIRLFAEGGMMVRSGIFMAAPALIGLAVAVDAGRRGYFLRIKKKRGGCKMAFSRNTSRSEADRFCELLRGSGLSVIIRTEQ